jgi:hypothetical protein
MKKKILVISPRYFPDNVAGGSITGCRSFVKTLIHAGYKVKLLTLKTANVPERMCRIDDAEIEYCNFSRTFDWLSKSGWGFSIDFLQRFRAIYKNYDLIYIRSIWNFPSLIAVFFSYKGQKKYMFCASGKLFPWALRQSRYKKAIVDLFFKRTFSSALAVHYASHEESIGCAHPALKNAKALFVLPLLSMMKK